MHYFSASLSLSLARGRTFKVQRVNPNNLLLLANPTAIDPTDTTSPAILFRDWVDYFQPVDSSADRATLKAVTQLVPLLPKAFPQSSPPLSSPVNQTHFLQPSDLHTVALASNPLPHFSWNFLSSLALKNECCLLNFASYSLLAEQARTRVRYAYFQFVFCFVG